MINRDNSRNLGNNSRNLGNNSRNLGNNSRNLGNSNRINSDNYVDYDINNECNTNTKRIS